MNHGHRKSVFRLQCELGSFSFIRLLGACTLQTLTSTYVDILRWGGVRVEPKNVGVGGYLLGSAKTLSWSVKRQGIFVLVFVLMWHRRADDRNVDKIWLWSKWCELRIDIQKSYRVTCNPICQRFLLTLFLLYEEINWSITTRKTPANMWNYLSQVIMDPN